MVLENINALLPAAIVPNIVVFLIVWVVLSLLKVAKTKGRLAISVAIAGMLSFIPAFSTVFSLIPPFITSNVSVVIALVVFVIGILIGRRSHKRITKAVVEIGRKRKRR